MGSEKLPLLSIRLMTYNHEAYIEEALKGIDIQKTDFNFEVVVGDDFSTDNTLNIIKSFPFKNEHLQLRILERKRGDAYDQERKKKGRLFNFTNIIDNCRGKYIAMLDGDDYWTDPHKLQKQVGLLSLNKDYMLCFHDVDMHNTRWGHNTKEPMNSNLTKKSFGIEDLFGQWFIATSSIVFRNIPEKNMPKWFYNCKSGDIPYFLNLALHGPFRFINKVMGVYRIHENGISVNHGGYYKAISMVYIYESFNHYTEYKFNEKINGAIKYELHKYLPEFEELRLLKMENEKLKRNFFYRYLNLIKSRLIK